MDRHNYPALLREIKTRIQGAQTRAALEANRELLLLYWDVGRLIASRQAEQGWGAAVIPRLAVDLASDLPGVKGFSERNLKRMIRFFREYPRLGEKVPPPVALSPEPPKVPPAAARAIPAAPEAFLALPWTANSIDDVLGEP